MAVDDSSPNLPAIISRAEAKAAGLKRYFPGTKCPKGHVAEHMIQGGCVVCHNIRNAAYSAANREQLREKAKVTYAANIDQENARSRAYREANHEKHRAAVDRWQKNNPDLLKIYSNNRRARKIAAEGSFTQEDVRRIYRAQNGRCAYCKTKLGEKYHADHIVPLSKGGGNDARNIQLLCQPCNQRKYDLDPVDYARKIGLLL